MEEEDAQLLYGAGSAPDLQGWMVSGGVSAFASTIAMADLVDGAQRYDVLVGSINELFVRHFSPNAVVVNPTDYHTMLLLKDTTNAYLRDPQTGLMTVLGVPVVMNTAVTSGQFLVVDTASVGFIGDRKAQTLEFSRENGDNFEKDLITVKATERIANVIERPNAGIYGTFTAAAALLETP
jgi:HK97 family phage major capsid protein